MDFGGQKTGNKFPLNYKVVLRAKSEKFYPLLALFYENN